VDVSIPNNLVWCLLWITCIVFDAHVVLR
jgi:hypothetical protein